MQRPILLITCPLMSREYKHTETRTLETSIYVRHHLTAHLRDIVLCYDVALFAYLATVIRFVLIFVEIAGMLIF
jgi:hypothetical protein